ncbi:hypothetical protein EDC04DRAFT_3139608 [Pisolithus marmoratus]|nr:hypothetical protein EDC04DRAFT_3139608 [Pisolithus marmoratus]
MRAPPTLDSWKDVYLLPHLSLSAELCTDPENPQSLLCLRPATQASPLQRWIVSGDKGAKATVWNAASHERVVEFAQGKLVQAVDISSDSTKIVTADNVTVGIFSTTSGIRLLPPLPHHYGRGVKFSPDGSLFAAASHKRGFRVYSTHDGDVLFHSGLESSPGDWPVTPLAWSPDDQQLFVASRGKIICFDLSKSSSSEWSTHETRSRAFIVSSGRFLAYSAGSLVSLWDCVSHKQISSILSHTAEIISVALSPSGGYLACGLKGGKIAIHNLRDVLSAKYFDHGLPLMRVSGEALKSWAQDDLANTEMLLSKEIASASSPRHYLLANRALVRTRLKHLALAMEDVKGSLQIQPLPIGYVAMAVVLLFQGDREGALCTFDLAFHDCVLHDISFLLLLKVLGVMYMRKGNYGRVMSLIERVQNLTPEDARCPHLETISLIYGWGFNGLEILAQQGLCETLYAEGRTAKATEIVLNIIRTSDREIQRSNATTNWIADFTKRCAMTLERVGDEAFESLKHDDAIAQYSTALSLSPLGSAGLLIKRSRARAAKGLWEDALQDANEAVKADPSQPWGYEARHVALHGAKRYDEAIDALESMLHAIEQSHDPTMRYQRKNYISPSQTIAAIDRIVRDILKSYPLVVIDVTTGYLCDGLERMRIFKAGPTFKELVSSMTRELDNDRILRVVASFFGYVMFSHAWQGNEPSFQDVNVVRSVWNLLYAPLNEKLRNFCMETRRLGHNWAWSDTCSTLVFLGGVPHPSKLGDLSRSFWMTRAWTLQELLAPKVILFYDSEWKPYLGNTSANHKESPVIMQELADAIKIPRGTIVTFSPDDLGVREKLRLASTRNATVVEDDAYSLIGLFKSDIRPHYGEGADALGHLLEEIVARVGEVTVLAWAGQSSSYNSCLPASTAVYKQTPYNPPSLEEEGMQACITELRGKLPQREALIIYKKIKSLRSARFATRRLHLPCIVFSVRGLHTQKLLRGNEKLYRAEVLGLGNVEFTTADDLPQHEPQKFVFAHPWISYIRGPSRGIDWEDDSEPDTDSDSGLDCDAGTDGVAPLPQVDRYARALQMIARLGQPFNALLFVQQPNGEYKRVAAENEIVASGLGTNITSKNIHVKVLEIL